MGLKLLKRGKTWYIRGTVRGNSVFQTTGTRDKSLAEAIRIKTEKRLLDESVYGKASVVTFRQAVEDYAAAGGSLRFLLDVKADGSEGGLVPHFNETLLSTIGQVELDKAARDLHPAAQPETLNRQVYTPFIAVWNHAFADEPNMARKWKRPRKPKGTNVVRLTKRRAGTFPVEYEHAAKFVAAMSPAPAMIMTALFYTGMRPIELFALLADEVNVKGRWITLEKSKTGEPRGIPMHEFLVPLFESLLKRNALAEDGRLFRAPRGEPYPPVEGGGGGLKTAIQGARRRSGIKDVAPYTGRHTASTGLVIAGVHPHIKDQILGHAADDMSRHYTNVPQAPLIEAINKLPVPAVWRALPWWQDPLAWSGKLAEGTGRRTDLEKKNAS
jgi:integrase